MPKVIALEGGYNFRDLGGYATKDGKHTKYGILYRSGALHKLTNNDHDTLINLSIQCIFDLREATEHDQEGLNVLPEHVELIYMPTTLGRDAMTQELQTDALGFRMKTYYKSSLAPRMTYHADLFKQILQHIESAPVVFHCSAGKDRTGIVAALILRVVGVADEDIIADYAETTEHLADYAKHQGDRFRGYGLPESAVQELLGSAPETMQDFLTFLDSEFGSAEAYLMQGGVTAAELDRFRQLFIA